MNERGNQSGRLFALDVGVKNGWLWLFSFAIFVGLINASIEITDDLARDQTPEMFGSLIREMTGALSVVVLLPFVLWFFRRFPLQWGSLLRLLPLYVFANLLFALSHTTLMTVGRDLLYPLFGLGNYDPGSYLYRSLMELHKQLLIFWFIFAVLRFFQNYEEQKKREIKTAELERKLSKARLDLLRLQLNPHFLFNTLNLISSFMYEDVQKADRMISNLSELLRASLSLSQVQEVKLHKEIELLRLFMEIMRARFEERLKVEIEIENTALQALFPTLLLQPLVENSIKHGLDGAQGTLQVTVSGEIVGDRLAIRVDDNGPGIDSIQGAQEAGIGLSSSRERLQELYGSAASFSIQNIPSGGARVELLVPLHYDR